MASVKDFYKRKLLAAKDMKGKSIVGIVSAVYPETQKQKDKPDSTKLIVELDDGEVRVALNKTNALILGKELGDDTDLWIGKKVKASVVKTTFQGQPCDGIALHKA